MAEKCDSDLAVFGLADELEDEVLVLFTRGEFDAAGDIDGVGADDADGLADISGAETAGEKKVAIGMGGDEIAGDVPIQTVTRAAIGSGYASVEEDVRRCKRQGILRGFDAGDADGLDPAGKSGLSAKSRRRGTGRRRSIRPRGFSPTIPAGGSQPRRRGPRHFRVRGSMGSPRPAR